ncbi:MAG TPA: hypothetical protein VK832_00395 [Burkholderiaceae bacterium]|nr:hypothetical protein [Burkholderiaceae bacterium]
MTEDKQPGKEQVQGYWIANNAQRSPLPGMQQIKRELGLDLIEAQRMANSNCAIYTNLARTPGIPV